MIKIGLFLLIVPCLMLMGLYLPEQSSAADCVAQGGSFNYAQQLCDMQNQQTSSTFMSRNTVLVNTSMLTALLGFIVCIVGLYRPAKSG
jgi:preprotein translocase subunit SecG